METWKKMWVGVFFLNTVYVPFRYLGPESMAFRNGGGGIHCWNPHLKIPKSDGDVIWKFYQVPVTSPACSAYNAAGQHAHIKMFHQMHNSNRWSLHVYKDFGSSPVLVIQRQDHRIVHDSGIELHPFNRNPLVVLVWHRPRGRLRKNRLHGWSLTEHLVARYAEITIEADSIIMRPSLGPH